MATKTECAICETKTATIRIVAADADGTVLDEIFICNDERCRKAASGELACGQPTQPFMVRH